MPKTKKLPRNHVIAGLVALILILAAPAIVAAIDKEAHTLTADPVGYDEEELIQRINARNIGTDLSTSAVIPGWTAFYPSENAGSYLINTTLTARHIWHLDFLIGSAASGHSPIITDNASTITVISDASLLGVTYNPTGLTGQYMHFDQVAPGHFVLNLSPAERLLLAGYTDHELLTFRYWVSGPPVTTFPVSGIIEFSVSFERSPIPLFYASLIYGAVGILLLIVAVYSTPWVNQGTVTKALRGGGKK
ncbi:MAG: hypothetical protein FWD92_04035 [Methanomassiliicoccaceae archaeon]|nr:hypothetical protein [Methanomassiliicoccaceae archaeon]